jgi:hypothetical protein
MQNLKITLWNGNPQNPGKKDAAFQPYMNGYILDDRLKPDDPLICPAVLIIPGGGYSR